MACTEVSKFDGTWNFIAKKLQVEDTEAFQKMMRMNWETFCKILLATCYNYKLFYNLPFQFEPVLGKTADWRAIFHYPPLVQMEKTIINYHVKFEHVQTTWYI